MTATNYTTVRFVMISRLMVVSILYKVIIPMNAHGEVARADAEHRSFAAEDNPCTSRGLRYGNFASDLIQRILSKQREMAERVEALVTGRFQSGIKRCDTSGGCFYWNIGS